MKPKSLYRSLTFWSGILVMAFVCLGWLSSYFYGSWLGWDCFTAANANGGIRVDSAYSRSGFSGGGESKIAFNDDLKDSIMIPPFMLRGTANQAPRDKSPVLDTYRGELESMMDRRDTRAWLIYIPHWLILLIVALPWTGLLFWRARRIRRETQFTI